MRKTIRNIGVVIGAALTALALFGVSKVWAAPKGVDGAQQSVVKASHISASVHSQDDTSKNWRRGRRR